MRFECTFALFSRLLSVTAVFGAGSNIFVAMVRLVHLSGLFQLKLFSDPVVERHSYMLAQAAARR